MSAGPVLSSLSHEQKDALIAALMTQVASLTARVAELEAKLGLPPKTPDNSSVPPSKGLKPSECSAPKDKAKPHAGAVLFIPTRPRSAKSWPAAAKAAGRMCPTSRKAYARVMIGSKSRDPARRDAGFFIWRRLPMLRQALQGRTAGRVGAGVAVRAEPARLCGLSALRSGDSPGAIEPCAARPVWPGDQRGRAGQHSFRQPEALRGADEPDQGAADGRHGAGLG